MALVLPAAIQAIVLPVGAEWGIGQSSLDAEADGQDDGVERAFVIPRAVPLEVDLAAGRRRRLHAQDLAVNLDAVLLLDGLPGIEDLGGYGASLTGGPVQDGKTCMVVLGGGLGPVVDVGVYPPQPVVPEQQEQVVLLLQEGDLAASDSRSCRRSHPGCAAAHDGEAAAFSKPVLREERMDEVERSNLLGVEGDPTLEASEHEEPLLTGHLHLLDDLAWRHRNRTHCPQNIPRYEHANHKASMKRHGLWCVRGRAEAKRSEVLPGSTANLEVAVPPAGASGRTSIP
nr:hypothetical protein [Hyalangium versicolor]